MTFHTFLAVEFPSSAAAEDALQSIRDAGEEDKLALRDAAIVARTARGDIELLQSHEIAAGEALVGAGTVGLVAGLLLGLPIGGALVGLAGGAVLGLRDTGIPDDRMRKLGEDLQPGQAVLCVLVDADTVRHARETLARHGEVVEVALSSDSDP